MKCLTIIILLLNSVFAVEMFGAAVVAPVQK